MKKMIKEKEIYNWSSIEIEALFNLKYKSLAVN